MKRRLVALAAGLVTIALLLVIRAEVSADDFRDRLEQVSDSEWRGTWHFSRGGPYVLGTQCDDLCTLRVDGKQVTRGKGIKLRRVVYAPGRYSIEISAPRGGRLLWHPPGRRGPPEYVPVSTLSRGDEHPSGTVGASISDGVISLAILLVLIATLWFVLRGVFLHPNREERTRWLEVLAVFAVAFAVRAIGIGDAGQTWDEDVNWSAGRNYVTNLLGLDFEVRSWLWNLEHPPLMKYLVGIGAQFADGYGPARVVSAVMMSIACALLVPIATRLGFSRAGLYAGIVAALSPHLVGHGQIVGHESAMALTWGLAITCAICVWPGGTFRLETRLALCGAAIGLALGARFVNGVVGIVVLAIVILRAPAERRIEATWKGATIMPIVAIVVFVLLWPRMWQAPIEHLEQAWTILRKPHSPEWFLGTFTNRPARWYFLVYLVATAPLGLLACSAAGLGWTLANKRKVAAILGVWMLAPLIVSLSPVRQDGVRYIIPSLLALAFAAGIGLEIGGQWLGRRLAKPRLGALPAAIAAVYLAFACIAIRPYFIDYYGEHVGGAKGVAAEKRFEIAWWGEGLSEAIDYLNTNAEPNASVYRCVVPSHLTWMRHDLWAKATTKIGRANWALIYAPMASRCASVKGFELVFEVRASGAPLAQVYRRRN